MYEHDPLTERIAQLLAYMRALKLQVGLLLNFNGETLRSGLGRLAI